MIKLPQPSGHTTPGDVTKIGPWGPFSAAVPWLFSGFVILSGLLPETWVRALEFSRGPISEGQYWRILTGQWVHFGFNHSLMNGLCLALVQYQLINILPLRMWLFLQLVIQLLVGGGLFYFSQDVDIYRGYSGAFCGILAFGLLFNLSREGWVLALIYAGLLGKILLEQSPAYDIHYLQGLIGVAVATDAHLYGFIAGTAVASIWLLKIFYTKRASIRKFNR